MFTDNKEKIEIINKPGLEYWPKISLYLKKNYRKNHPILNKNFFFWLFLNKDKFSIFILLYKKKIQSMMGYKKLKINIDNIVCNSFWLTFFSSINNGSGHILFRKINSIKTNVLTLNANKSGSVFYNKYKWESENIKRNIIIFNLKKTKKLLIKNTSINYLKKFGFNEKFFKENFVLKPLEKKMIYSLRRIKPYENGVIKTKDYILWRYYNHPKFKYELFYEGELNKDDMAFIVIRKENYFGFQKGKVCRIVDFFVQNNSKSRLNLKKLLVNIFSYLKKNNFEFADFYNNNEKYNKLFNSLKVSKVNKYNNFLISRMSPLLKENFKMSFYYKLCQKYKKQKILVTKSDIDGDVPEFI